MFGLFIVALVLGWGTTMTPIYKECEQAQFKGAGCGYAKKLHDLKSKN